MLQLPEDFSAFC